MPSSFTRVRIPLSSPFIHPQSPNSTPVSKLPVQSASDASDAADASAGTTITPPSPLIPIPILSDYGRLLLSFDSPSTQTLIRSTTFEDFLLSLQRHRHRHHPRGPQTLSSSSSFSSTSLSSAPVPHVLVSTPGACERKFGLKPVPDHLRTEHGKSPAKRANTKKITINTACADAATARSSTSASAPASPSLLSPLAGALRSPMLGRMVKKVNDGLCSSPLSAFFGSGPVPPSPTGPKRKVSPEMRRRRRMKRAKRLGLSAEALKKSEEGEGDEAAAASGPGACFSIAQDGSGTTAEGGSAAADGQAEPKPTSRTDPVPRLRLRLLSERPSLRRTLTVPSPRSRAAPIPALEHVLPEYHVWTLFSALNEVVPEFDEGGASYPAHASNGLDRGASDTGNDGSAADGSLQKRLDDATRLVAGWIWDAMMDIPGEGSSTAQATTDELVLGALARRVETSGPRADSRAGSRSADQGVSGSSESATLSTTTLRSAAEGTPGCAEAGSQKPSPAHSPSPRSDSAIRSDSPCPAGNKKDAPSEGSDGAQTLGLPSGPLDPVERQTEGEERHGRSQFRFRSRSRTRTRTGPSFLSRSRSRLAARSGSSGASAESPDRTTTTTTATTTGPDSSSPNPGTADKTENAGENELEENDDKALRRFSVHDMAAKMVDLMAKMAKAQKEGAHSSLVRFSVLDLSESESQDHHRHHHHHHHYHQACCQCASLRCRARKCGSRSQSRAGLSESGNNNNNNNNISGSSSGGGTGTSAILSSLPTTTDRLVRGLFRSMKISNSRIGKVKSRMRLGSAGADADETIPEDKLGGLVDGAAERADKLRHHHRRLQSCNNLGGVAGGVAGGGAGLSTPPSGLSRTASRARAGTSVGVSSGGGLGGDTTTPGSEKPVRAGTPCASDTRASGTGTESSIHKILARAGELAKAPTEDDGNGDPDFCQDQDHERDHLVLLYFFLSHRSLGSDVRSVLSGGDPNTEIDPGRAHARTLQQRQQRQQQVNERSGAVGHHARSQSQLQSQSQSQSQSQGQIHLHYTQTASSSSSRSRSRSQSQSRSRSHTPCPCSAPSPSPSSSSPSPPSPPAWTSKLPVDTVVHLARLCGRVAHLSASHRARAADRPDRAGRRRWWSEESTSRSTGLGIPGEGAGSDGAAAGAAAAVTVGVASGAGADAANGGSLHPPTPLNPPSPSTVSFLTARWEHQRKRHVPGSGARTNPEPEPELTLASASASQSQLQSAPTLSLTLPLTPPVPNSNSNSNSKTEPKPELRLRLKPQPELSLKAKAKPNPDAHAHAHADGPEDKRAQRAVLYALLCDPVGRAHVLVDVARHLRSVRVCGAEQEEEKDGGRTECEDEDEDEDEDERKGEGEREGEGDGKGEGEGEGDGKSGRRGGAPTRPETDGAVDTITFACTLGPALTVQNLVVVP